jgi:hypothetical protein
MILSVEIVYIMVYLACLQLSSTFLNIVDSSGLPFICLMLNNSCETAWVLLYSFRPSVTRDCAIKFHRVF